MIQNLFSSYRGIINIRGVPNFRWFRGHSLYTNWFPRPVKKINIFVCIEREREQRQREREERKKYLKFLVFFFFLPWRHALFSFAMISKIYTFKTNMQKNKQIIFFNYTHYSSMFATRASFECLMMLNNHPPKKKNTQKLD